MEMKQVRAEEPPAKLCDLVPDLLLSNFQFEALQAEEVVRNVIAHDSSAEVSDQLRQPAMTNNN